MIRRLIILLLIVGCDILKEEDVYGCTDPNAPNFDSNANIFDNSCEYSAISEFTDFETIQGMDEFGNPTELIGSGNWGGCYEQNFYRSSLIVVSTSAGNAFSAPYPNPFSNSTSIGIAVPQDSEVKMFITNQMQIKIATLVDDTLHAGYYSITWDGNNEQGNPVEDGYYRVIIDFGSDECFANLHLIRPSYSGVIDTNFVNQHWNLARWIHDYYKWYEYKEDDDDWNAIREVFINHSDSTTGCAQDPTMGHCYVDICDHSHRVEFTYDGGTMSSNSEEFKEVFRDLCGNTNIWDRGCSNEIVSLYDNNNDSIFVIKDDHFYEGIQKYNMFTAGWDDNDSIYVITSDNNMKTAMTPHKLHYQELYFNP